jgi:hypothetical protein
VCFVTRSLEVVELPKGRSCLAESDIAEEKIARKKSPACAGL